MKTNLRERLLHFLSEYFYKLERRNLSRQFQALHIDNDEPYDVVRLSNLIDQHIQEMNDMKNCLDDLWNRLPTNDYRENIRIWNMRYRELLRVFKEDMVKHLDKHYPDHTEWDNDKNKELMWIKENRPKRRL